MNYISIPLENEAVVNKVLVSNYNDKDDSVVFLLVDVKGERHILSAGKNKKGLLGQGKKDGADVIESRKFTKLDYDHTNTNFTEVFAGYDHAFAVTDKGELYGWGCNIHRRLGHDTEGDKFSPTKLEKFNDYFIHSVACGSIHSVIIAHKREDPSQRKVILTVGIEESIIAQLGITKEEF